MTTTRGGPVHVSQVLGDALERLRRQAEITVCQCIGNRSISLSSERAQRRLRPHGQRAPGAVASPAVSATRGTS